MKKPAEAGFSVQADNQADNSTSSLLRRRT